MTTIRIPTPLRPYTGGNSSIDVNGSTVGAALSNLTEQHPDLRPHLFEGDELRSFVNVFLNQEDVRYLEGADTEVADNDTLMIIPSIAGGK
ncbi:MAG: molybdopterin synthase sulfur carrier subunit [Chloroflexi bacterium]|nr:MAG: molybdopterin synthase sulfur carrier subunit [Chloroflexota bacterium]